MSMRQAAPNAAAPSQSKPETTTGEEARQACALLWSIWRYTERTPAQPSRPHSPRPVHVNRDAYVQPLQPQSRKPAG